MEVSIDQTGPFAVVTLRGEWRGTGDDNPVDRLHPLVSEAGAQLVIDLSGVEMIDSSGLSALIGVVTHARLSNARAVLVAPVPFVRSVFDVTHLDGWFEICGDVNEATALLTG